MNEESAAWLTISLHTHIYYNSCVPQPMNRFRKSLNIHYHPAFAHSTVRATSVGYMYVLCVRWYMCVFGSRIHRKWVVFGDKAEKSESDERCHWGQIKGSIYGGCNDNTHGHGLLRGISHTYIYIHRRTTRVRRTVREVLCSLPLSTPRQWTSSTSPQCYETEIQLKWEHLVVIQPQIL